MTKRERRVVSAGVRGRRTESRLNKTSEGVCNLDWVVRKMFSGERIGRVLRRKTRETRTRATRERKTVGDKGRTARPCWLGPDLMER